MRKYIFILMLLVLQLYSCQNRVNTITQEEANKQIDYKPLAAYTETYYKIVKSVKSISKQKTDYSYKFDWLNGKFRQQPNVYTKNKYYLVFTDGTSQEITMEQSVIYEKGDSFTITITKYK